MDEEKRAERRRLLAQIKGVDDALAIAAPKPAPIVMTPPVPPVEEIDAQWTDEADEPEPESEPPPNETPEALERRVERRRAKEQAKKERRKARAAAAKQKQKQKTQKARRPRERNGEEQTKEDVERASTPSPTPPRAQIARALPSTNTRLIVIAVAVFLGLSAIVAALVAR